MAYLIGPKTAEFLRDAMRQGMDLRSRRKIPPRATGGGGGVASLPPQWRVWHGVETPEPEQEGDTPEPVYTLHCAGGTVWFFDVTITPHAAGSSGDRNTEYDIETVARSATIAAVDLGEAQTGRVVWRWSGDGDGAVVIAADGEPTPEGAWDVVLAEVAANESGAPTITQRQIDTIFFTVPTGEEPEPDPDEPPDDAPPCGNPLNEGGEIENPLDGGGGSEGSGGSSEDDPDRNPLDHPGDGGFTPWSSGEKPCPETDTEAGTGENTDDENNEETDDGND